MITFTKPKNFDLDQIYKSGQCFRWWKRMFSGYEVPIIYDKDRIAVKADEERVYVAESREYYENIFDYFDLGQIDANVQCFLWERWSGYRYSMGV